MAKAKTKSLLDNIPVDDIVYKETMSKISKPKILGIVGTCTLCGAPIYGQNICSSEELPNIKKSCECKFTTPPEAYLGKVNTK